ncbi:MAG: hypothetical protein JWO60_2007 [Frankiales bacterium]|nr:hypothetical protein [Frankiales bacterium]
MFHDGDADWAVPGVPRDVVTEAPTAPDLHALEAAVEQVLATLPAHLPPDVALDRAGRLLRVQERLRAAALTAVEDVEERDLWAGAAAGSTRTWLRSQPCGDTGQLAAVRALKERPHLRSAVADGRVSLRTALTVARVLARVPGSVEADQLEAVLVDGLGDLLSVWTGAVCLEPTPEQEAVFEARRARVRAVVGATLADSWCGPAERLEPAFLLAAEVLAPAEVAPGLELLADALQPEAALDDVAQQCFRDRSTVLRKLSSGMWSLRATLLPEAGQVLYDQLQAERGGAEPEPPARKGGLEDVFGPVPHGDTAAEAPHDASTRPAAGDEPEGMTEPTAAAGADDAGGPDAELLGQAGPGVPPTWRGRAVEGPPMATPEQRDHDAFARLLLGVQRGRNGKSRAPARALVSITARLDTLEGRLGAPPGTLHTAAGPVRLSSATVRRHMCGGQLAAVLLDVAGRPVTASGEHRHATRRERRAMRAAWGSTCAVNGCTLTGVVPHHVEPFNLSGQTRLADLAPLCEHHHHDVHEGHKTLRLRDGRRIDDRGWVSAA